MITITFAQACIVIYLVGYIISLWLVYDHLRNPRRYRITFSLVASIFWPVGAALILMMWVDELIYKVGAFVGDFFDKR